ncbi:uncharacterized protein VTP21DRAFT_2441 [Calcarisporiella thermophila]|uniref:uncharacterized protein n=1 Tax=Calcarisporiella thermophila TaxID=911321 RepID=UPI0037441DF1
MEAATRGSSSVPAADRQAGIHAPCSGCYAGTGEGAWRLNSRGYCKDCVRVGLGGSTDKENPIFAAKKERNKVPLGMVANGMGGGSICRPISLVGSIVSVETRERGPLVEEAGGEGRGAWPEQGVAKFCLAEMPRLGERGGKGGAGQAPAGIPGNKSLRAQWLAGQRKVVGVWLHPYSTNERPDRESRVCLGKAKAPVFGWDAPSLGFDFGQIILPIWSGWLGGQRGGAGGRRSTKSGGQTGRRARQGGRAMASGAQG